MTAAPVSNQAGLATVAGSGVPVVTIIMLVYNRPQFLGRAAASAGRQTLTQWELLIIQDGDNAEVAAIAQTLAEGDARIRHVRRRVPGNIADATNHGLTIGRGEFIAILDDDDQWECEDKLAQQVEFLRAHPDHLVCGGGVIVVDAHGQELLRYAKPLSDEEIRKVALVANPIAHSSSLFRRAVALQIHGYDAEGLSDFQDWDFWLKLGAVGKLANLDVPLLRYTMWDQGASVSRQRSAARSALKIWRRHRHRYPRQVRAFLMVYGYFAYTLLPRRLRHWIFTPASLAKKKFFSPK